MYSYEKLQFLDTEVVIQGDTLVTDLFVKPTDKNTLVRYESHHPRPMIESLPLSQMLRVARIVDVSNKTQVAEFVFSGLTKDKRLENFLFTLFMVIYLVTIVANLGLVAIVRTTSTLQIPMYYFLSYLSLVDIFYSSTITPKMLSDLKSLKKNISFEGCALQFFFYASLASIDSLILSIMSYDRYVAICHPLHYMTIMTKKKCLYLVLLSFSIGFLQSSVQTSCAFSLQFCGSNLINHFYCDAPLLFRLSCSDTSTCDKVTVYIVSAMGMGPLMTILLSYLLIVLSISRIQSADGKKKAFSTCSSHIICISIFYGTIFFTYFRPSSSVFTIQDKVASVFYTAVTPMLNPLIYSLRNQDVKRVVIALLSKQLGKMGKWCH
ncbi:olfactory receptor 1019-like [Bufo bufo]|uniref:olfactory receptor 1019-like n=1 Tax=Bufo bufo TaxID=8384 RepID=UPI001ABDA6F7|nr:olfactory receptor 1019-like [Bufo bufo]